MHTVKSSFKTTLMSESAESLMWLVVVGLLWGGTNPFLKRGSCGMERVQDGNPIRKFVKELIFLFTNLNYMMPFILNQCGSLVYFLTLQKTDMSLAVPVANSLTFVFTAVVGWLMGEGSPNLKMVTGMFLVWGGICLCVLDKTVH